MLSTLRIKNLALVEDLTWELPPGLNIITGETGAGKSILIGALNLVLGERADRTLIRAGADACSVEAVFQVTDEHHSQTSGSTDSVGNPKRQRTAALQDASRNPTGFGVRQSSAALDCACGLGYMDALLQKHGLEPCEGGQLIL